MNNTNHKYRRQHTPCRVCNAKHNSNCSSSLCGNCGPKIELDNLKTKEEIRLSKEADND